MQVNSQERDNIETTITALVLSQKRGCSLSQLCKDYYDLEGEHIPWKRLGYASLNRFLKSMKTVQIEDRNNVRFLQGIASDKSKHITKLIAGQKDQKHSVGRKTYKPSHYYPNTAPLKVQIPAEVLSIVIGMVNEYPDGVNKDFVFQTVQTHMPYVDITMSEMEEQLHMLSHKIHVSNNKIFPILNKSDTVQSRSPVVTASGNENLDNICEYVEEGEDDFQFMSSTCISASFHDKSLAKTKTTSSFIKETVSKCQDQYVKAEFNTLTSKVGIDENNWHNCGNSTEIRTEYNNNSNSNINKEHHLDNKYTEDLINDRVKFRLEKLIQNNPNGIWCAELPEKYLEEYKVCLNYTELGFSSVREFASQLPEIFHCIRTENTGDFMLYYAKKDVPLNDSKEKHKTINLAELHKVYLMDEEDDALPTTLSINTCNQLIPDGIVTIGESVGQLSVTGLVSDEKPYIEVVVVEVFTPAFFWIQLRKKQKTFKTFMDELHNFYVTNHQDYVVPPVVLERGLNCACIYNGIWHRGIIKSVKPDLQVTVMFYDYGTLKTYPPDAVYYLHRMFSLLPAQAIPCGLFNTRPYKTLKWTRNATHQFAVRTSTVPLIATVASMNAEENSMMVTLTDTLEEEDVHINDWLVEHKLAEHGKMVCIKSRNFPFRYHLQCQERRKQKSKTFQSRKLVQPSECKKSMRAVGCSQNKVELSQKSNKTLQYSKNKHSIKETDSSTPNSEQKQPKNLTLLYEKLLNFKRNSKPCNTISTERSGEVKSDKSLKAESVLSKQIKQTLRKESQNNIIKCDNNEYDDTFTSSQSCDKNIHESLSKKEDILRNYANIPKEYANHFHIQHSEDELDIMCTETSSDISNEFKHVDWSGICKDVEQRKERVSQQNDTKRTYKSISEKRDNIPLAESYFLKAVRNSVHFTEHDEDIRWLPTGNINKTEDPSPLVLRNIQKQAANSTTEKIVAVPKKMLSILTENKSAEFLESSTVISERMNEIQCIESTQSNDNLVCSNDDAPCNTNIQMNSDNDTPRLENYYTHIKPRIPINKLLQLWSMKQHKLSQSSSLDSDDLTVSNVSISSQESFTNDDRESKIKESGMISNRAESRLNTNDLSNFVETENTLESSECKSCKNEPQEELDSSMGSVSFGSSEPCRDKNKSFDDLKSAVNSISLESSKSVSCKSTSSEEFVSTDKSLTSDSSDEIDRIESRVMESKQVENSAEELEQIESTLSAKETIISKELVSISEALSPDVITVKSTVPVFNDIYMESDTEEWDVYVPVENLHHFLKIDSPFDRNTENTLHAKDNSCLTVEEVNDMDSIKNTDRIDTDKEQEDNTYEEIDNTEYSSVKCGNLENWHNEVATTFNNNEDSNRKKASVYSESRGKSRTLLEMLNKAKVKQRN